MKPLLSEKQRAYWREARRRWNVKTGATRSGKTYMDYFLLPKRLLAGEGRDGLNVILGNTRGTIARNVILPMQAIYGSERVGDIRTDNTCLMFGQKVYCLGADSLAHVDRIRGSSIKYCYGDEVATWREEVFDMLKSRMDKPYSLFDGTCNPEGPDHWFYRFLQSDADIFQQRYTLDDNPFLDPGFVRNLKREYEGTVLYDRYINGLWVAAEGALFVTEPSFTDDPACLRDGIAHIDAAYGGEDATALTLGMRRGDTLYLYGRLWRAHVDSVLGEALDLCRRYMCEPVFTEMNADKGYLSREIRRRGFSARGYHEKLNKYVKISAYLRKWWKNIRFLSGTDKSYLAQIMSYTERAAHDDAPDSAACAARYFDRRGGEL